MKITATGFYEGARRRVTWTEGALVGDPGAIAVLEVRSATMGPQCCGPRTGGGVTDIALDEPGRIRLHHPRDIARGALFRRT